MERERGKAGTGRTVSAGYIAAAVVIWMLVAYALSPLSRPPPTWLAARTVPACDRTLR
jgi:hypothetical protein